MAQPLDYQSSQDSQFSDTQTSTREPCRNLGKFFAIKPPPYIVETTAGTRDTRRPKFFDLHLAEPLQLKNMVLSDDLPEILATVCDQRINAPSDTQPLHKDSEFDRELQTLVGGALEYPTEPMLTEDDIAKHYSARTSYPSLRVASKIALPSTRIKKWAPIFQWHTTSTTNEAALCDGYVTVSTGGNFVKKLTQEDRARINALERNLLLKFVLAEFKSLAAGDLATMEAILDITASDSDFPWMTCGASHFNKVQECKVDKHTNRHLQTSLTGRKTGPDSDLSWWDNSKPGKRKASGNSSSDTQPARSQRPAKGRPDLSEAAFTAIKKAHYIIQQVWAELVHEDATFAIISSGNYEIYLRRHRETQTLYVSNIVRPDSNENPCHYKLHTALYVAGWLDADNRAMQLDVMLSTLEAVSSSDSLPEDTPRWARSYLTDFYDEDSHKYPPNNFWSRRVKLTSQEKKQAVNDEVAKVKTVLVHLENANIIKLRLPKSVWGGQDLLVFKRKEAKYAEQSSPHNEMNLEIIAMNSKQLASTKVWRARVNMSPGPDKRTFSSGELIVMKLAKTIPTRQALKEEYIRHKQFFAWSPDSFLRAYGLFQCPMPGGDIIWDALILQYGGKSLEDLMRSKPTEEVRVRYRDAIVKSTLKPLHAHGVLHQSLTSDNLLFQKKGAKMVFYSIGFKECEFLWMTKDEEKVKKKDKNFMEEFQHRKRLDVDNVRLALEL